MKRPPRLHPVLAAVGIVSLLVYVLACTSFTSFSPDDSKVLYPAFDPQSGAIAVAVYDRRTRRSEQVYVSAPIAEQEGKEVDRLPIRAEWLPDGKHIVVGAPVDDEDGLSFLVVPYGVHEPVRALPRIESEEAGLSLLYRFVLIGPRLHLSVSEGRQAARIDLLSGEVKLSEFPSEVVLLPTTDGKLAYWREEKDAESDVRTGVSYGLVNPETMELAPGGHVSPEIEGADGVAPVISRDGKSLVTGVKEDGRLRLVVVRDGKPVVTRALDHGEDEVAIGPHLDLSPQEDRAYTPYCLKPKGGGDAEVGLLEVPFDQTPLRWTPLLRAPLQDDDDMLVFQGSLSHDGETWAAASSSLYLKSESVKAEDCALFLVNLRGSKRAVTKVPIAPPPVPRALAGN